MPSVPRSLVPRRGVHAWAEVNEAVVRAGRSFQPQRKEPKVPVNHVATASDPSRGLSGGGVMWTVASVAVALVVHPRSSGADNPRGRSVEL